MSIEIRKVVWWLVLASCGGVMLIILATLINGLIFWKMRYLGAECIWFCLELPGIVVAWLKLQKCYDEQPLKWSGQWQYSLSDLLSIVFVFACTMAIAQEIRPARFLKIGLPISLAIGIGYAISLLFVARMEQTTRAVDRWAGAFFVFIRTILILGLGMFFQWAALMLIAVIFIAKFRVGVE